METTTLKVEGMSCGGCVKSVTNVLSALPGVAKAEVSLENKSARVEFEAGCVTREDMKRVIVDAGFVGVCADALPRLPPLPNPLPACGEREDLIAA